MLHPAGGHQHQQPGPTPIMVSEDQFEAKKIEEELKTCSTLKEVVGGLRRKQGRREWKEKSGKEEFRKVSVGQEQNREI